MKIFEKGFHYGQDGHGNRIVIHMQGCNLRCPWCANPEGLHPDGVMTRRNGEHSARLSCEDISVPALLSLCESGKPLFFSGGGVTFTGGEPTLQPEELREILAALKRSQIHTAIETNGTWPSLPELFPLADQLIMDFKTANPEKHDKALGHGGSVVLRNLAAALNGHHDALIRVPLIDGFNTSEEALYGFLSAIGKGPFPNAAFEFLLFHEFGKEKWRQCGLEYRQPPAYVSPETAALFERAFTEAGLRVIKT